MKRTGLFFLSILYVLNLSVQAQEPPKNSAIAEATTISPKISYQGILADNDGNPLEGSFTMKFALYASETGGESIWNEAQSPVLVEKGVFHVLFGETNSLEGIPFDKPYWLEITVNDELLAPRIELSSSAYSFNTSRIQGQAVSVENPNNGEVLTWTGSHWEPEEAEPRGRAGGDLRGDYPDPEVDGLRGNLVSDHFPEEGEVLTWSRSNWRPEPIEVETVMLDTEESNSYTNIGTSIIIIKSSGISIPKSGRLLVIVTGTAYFHENGSALYLGLSNNSGFCTLQCSTIFPQYMVTNRSASWIPISLMGWVNASSEGSYPFYLRAYKSETLRGHQIDLNNIRIATIFVPN